MAGSGAIHVLSDVKASIGRLVGTGRRVVLLEGPKLKIQALEWRKAKIIGRHVGGWMRI